MDYTTARFIINDTAKLLGLIAVDLPDPLASSNQNILQLVALLSELGQNLARKYDWQHLRREGTFTTSDGVAAYDLEDDYHRFINDTLWNVTRQWPAQGPLNDSQWQALQVQSVSGLVYPAFQVLRNQINLFPTPTTAEDYSYKYMSDCWVASPGEEPDGIDINSADNFLWFDRALLKAGLKLAYKKAKGFDTTAASDEFDDALAIALGASSPAPTLSLNGRSATGFRMIDEDNVPETGFGD